MRFYYSAINSIVEASFKKCLFITCALHVIEIILLYYALLFGERETCFRGVGVVC